jgi:hypothetical protein
MATTSRRSSAERGCNYGQLPSIARWSDMVSLKLSCSQASLYPQNIIRPREFEHELKRLTVLLNTLGPQLFAAESDACVELWQVEDDNFHHEKLHSCDQLPAHLSTNAPFALRHLQCRFIFLQCYKQSSNERLAITREMMSNILSYHQIMPPIVGLLASFGRNSHNSSKFCSSFQVQVRFSWDVSAIAVPELNRSGRILELCYNLSAIEPNRRNARWPWSITNFAIAHSLDIKTGQSIWMVLKADSALKDCIMSATQPGAHSDITFPTGVSQCVESCLRTHLLCCEWASASWPWYINHLEDTHTTLLALASRPKFPFQTEETFLHDLLIIQNLQDRINEAILVLTTTDKVLEQLRSLYSGLHKEEEWPPRSFEKCRVQLARFESQMQKIQCGIELHRTRLECLRTLVESRKTLVCIQFPQEPFDSVLTEIVTCYA